jgi:hypothetical protein
MQALLPINAIIVDPEIQPRVEQDEVLAQEYAEQIKFGDLFPPVQVFCEGEKYWLADGFHRHRAHVLAGQRSIQAEVHSGGKRDAIWFAVKCNAKNGLRRTNQDKRKAVMMLMDDPEWKNLSDNKIAKACLVTQPFVSKIRKEQINNGYSFEIEKEDVAGEDRTEEGLRATRSNGYMKVLRKRLKLEFGEDLVRARDPKRFLDTSPYDADAKEELDVKIKSLELEIKELRKTMQTKRNMLKSLKTQRLHLMEAAA